MRILVLAVLPLLLAAASTPPVPQKPLTTERIFESPSLSGPSPLGLKLSPDGKFATLLKPRASDRTRFDLWAVDTSSGAERMLVDSERFQPSGDLSEAEKMHRERAHIDWAHGIVEYEWAPDSRSILVPIGGDLYLAGLDGTIRRLTSGISTLNPQISETGKFVSFVQDQNLFALNVNTGASTQVTKSGGGTVTCGAAEFVAQEELDRFSGAWWSPDEKRIAVECYDEAKVEVFTRTAIGADGTRTYAQRYPAAGTPNVTASLWIAGPYGGALTKVDLGANPDIYIARVDWSQDGKVLYVQRESRDQQTLEVLAIDPDSGSSRVLLQETSKTWINLTDDFHALKDGSFLWGSQRDGFMHLYRLAHGEWTQLTHGDWMVTSLIGVDELRHTAYFVGTKDSVLEPQVYAVDYLNAREPIRLTSPGFVNRATMNKGGERMLVRRSSIDQPPQVYLADASGKRLAWMEENRLDANHPFAPYLASYREPQFGALTAADGSVLHYMMITPPLARGKKYPVLFVHYGGPTVGQMVDHGWSDPSAQYWVSKGWIYFMVDGRGSPNRGTAFESQLFHHLGSVEVDDQIAGAQWLKRQPFVDPDRIAIEGGSYGGYLTVKMLEKAPAGLFAAGIASSSVTRWELYDTAYTERYLGMPQDDPLGYASSDAVDDAPKIRTPLLIIHGTSDDNVFFENSAELISKLQGTDTPFEMMLYIGLTHGPGDEAREAHRMHAVERFLNEAVIQKSGAILSATSAQK